MMKTSIFMQKLRMNRTIYEEKQKKRENQGTVGSQSEPIGVSTSSSSMGKNEDATLVVGTDANQEVPIDANQVVLTDANQVGGIGT